PRLAAAMAPTAFPAPQARPVWANCRQWSLETAFRLWSWCCLSRRSGDRHSGGWAPIIQPIVILQEPFAAKEPHRRVPQHSCGAGAVIALAVARGEPLHFTSAAAPDRGIAFPGGGRIVGHAGETLRCNGGVFDGHGRALCQERQYRMRRIAQQRGRALRETRKRLRL